MSTLALSSIFLGALIGMRFKVFVLILGIAFALIANVSNVREQETERFSKETKSSHPSMRSTRGNAQARDEGPGHCEVPVRTKMSQRKDQR